MRPADTDDDATLVAELRELLQSAGWQRFEAFVESAWGDAATLHKVRSVVGKVPAGQGEAVEDVTQNILGQQQAVQAVLQWPREVVSAGTQEPRGRFAALRRIAR